MLRRRGLAPSKAPWAFANFEAETVLFEHYYITQVLLNAKEALNSSNTGNRKPSCGNLF